MLNDATCFKNVYIVTGYTDLRSGIDRLASLIKSKMDEPHFSPDTIYLFCGRRTDRIKGLIWESDGYLLDECLRIQHSHKYRISAMLEQVAVLNQKRFGRS